MKQLLVLLLLMTLFSQEGYAQLPTCDKIYIKVSGTYNTRGIYTYDPTLPVSTTNPKFNTCSEPPGFTQLSGSGLAVSPHLGTNDPRLTFYSVTYPSGIYSYYDIDSAKWKSTGHSSGGAIAYNIASGGGYLFNTDINGNVYRYNGAGNGVLVTTIPDAYLLGPLDLMADCQGNFYLLKLPVNNNSNIMFFRKYSSAGILLQSWFISQSNSNLGKKGGAGMAMIGSQIYFDDYLSTGSNIVFATVLTSSVNLDSNVQLPLVIDDDMASCAGFKLTLPTINIGTAQNPLCDNQTAHFLAATTTSGSMPHFQWTVNGIKAGIDSAVFSYVPVNGDTVRCTFLSSDFCASQITTTSNAIVMQVQPNTTPSVAIQASDTGILCANTLLQFKSTARNVGLTPSYQWYKNGISILGTNLPSYASTTAQNNDTFYMVVKSSAMCNTIDSAVSNKIGVQIGIPTPAVSLATMNSLPLCSGTLITIQANSSYLGNSPVFCWAINGIPWSGLSLSNAIFSNSFKDQDTITLNVQSSITCAQPKSVSAQHLVLNISPTIVPGCNINITPGTAMCLGSLVHFVTNTVGGGTKPNYQWLLNGTFWLSASGSSYTSSSLSNGDTVSILFSSNEVCATPDTVRSNPVAIHLDSVVYPTIKIDSLISTQPNGSQQYTFFARTLFGGLHPTFQWIKNGVNIPFATDSTYVSNSLVAGDEITVSMMSSENCPATIVVTSKIFVIRSRLSVKRGQSLTKEIIILPNPNNGIFTLHFDSSRTGRLLIKDAAGRLIYQQTIAGSDVQVRLPNEIGAGIYFVRFVEEDGDTWNGKVDVLL